MSYLSEVRERIEAYYRDTSPLGFSRQEIDPKGIADWMRYLQKQEIKFSCFDASVHYDSFYDIDFTGPEINHQEWRAQLNRFFWLQPLAVEYLRTGDERWAKLAHDSIDAWIDFKHYTGSETAESVWRDYGDNSLSCSIRLGQGKLCGWWGTIPYFEGSRYFDDTFIEKIRHSTVEQLNYLIHNVTRNGNFRISQMDTFLFLGLILPEGKPYLPYAVDVLNTVFRLQVCADGAHVEHVSGYHKWMCDVFTQFAFLAKAHPELGLQIDIERLCDMWRYTYAHMTPDGGNWGIGDSSCWAGSGKADKAAFVDSFNRLRAWFGLPAASIERAAFPEAGQYFMHDGDTAFVLDASNFGGWHSHLARGALGCYCGGKLQLLDPGSFSYERSDPFMAAGRQTPTHNTITVNGMSQNTMSDARVTDFREETDIAFARCVYAGGWSTSSTQMWSDCPVEDIHSVGGRHTRTFLWLKGRFAVTLDVLEVLAPQAHFAAHWQMLDGPYCYDAAHHALHTDSKTQDLLICAPFASVPLSSACYRGDYEQHVGFHASNAASISLEQPAPMLSVEGDTVGASRAIVLHVLMPYADGNVPQITATGRVENGALYIQLTVDGKVYELAGDMTYLAGDNNFASIADACPLQSNAPFAVRTDDFGWEL